MSGCTIQLDNFLGYCLPGSTLSGKVVCVFRKTKSIREVRISLKGSEHTAWTEWKNYRDPHKHETRRRAVHYRGDNTFLAVEIALTGGGDIGPGIFEYPFTFLLPKNLPGTYSGTYGWVRYTIKASVDRPYQFDYHDEKDLNMIGLVDFNDMAGQIQLRPVGYSDTKTLCCCCCRSGPITMNVQLEKEAFVQGETVNVKVDVINMSNKSIEAIEVEIERKIESRVTSPTSRFKRNQERLAFSRETGVGAHGERTYSFLMEIPRTVSLANFNLCTLFTQWSKIKVVAVLPFSHTNLKVSTPIVMGHVPVGGQVQSVSFDQIAALQPYPPPQAEPYPPTLEPYPQQPYPPGPSNMPYHPPNNPVPYPPNISTQFPFPTNAPSHAFPMPVPSVSTDPLPPKTAPNFEPYSVPSAPASEGATAPFKSDEQKGEDRSPPPSYNDVFRPK